MWERIQHKCCIIKAFYVFEQNETPTVVLLLRHWHLRFDSQQSISSETETLVCVKLEGSIEEDSKSISSEIEPILTVYH
jgi:hypothetical protein